MLYIYIYILYQRHTLTPFYEQNEHFFLYILTKIHIIPSTTGLSEVGALRDAINSVLPPLIPSTEPSVLSLVNNSMNSMNVLPLNENGNNWLLNDLSSIELEYTVIQTSSTSTLSSIPEVGFFTEGDVTRDGSYNLQDIKGVKFGNPFQFVIHLKKTHLVVEHISL